MADYFNVTTNIGDAEIATAIASNTKLAITHIAFGDGNGAVPTPSKIRTTLVREVHRQPVTKYERHPINANWIVIETIIPSNVGGFTIREMGIIANGKLISHGSHAPFEKVADPSGVSEYRLRFTQNVTDGSVVEITLDESLIYASQAWVEENFIKRTEIVDNLITADPNKPLSANAGKSLQDGKLGKNDNAVSATKLQTARTIGGVSFNGTANINLPGVNAAGNQSTSGNAATATKLATIRSLSFSGDASGTMSFDGSADVSTNLTLSNTGVVAGTYKSVTVDAKGRISAGNDVITGLVTATTATGTANQATSNTNTFLNITEKIGSTTTTVGTSTQVTGAGTVSVTSDTTGKITITGAQSITGNAATATKLETARTINGVNFDGTQGITVADATKLPLAGGALTGDVTSTGTLKINNTTASTSAATGAFTTTGGLGVAKDLFVGGAISGALLSANSANLNVVTGTDYTITYDYATRLAHIQMRVFTNQSIYLGLPYSGSNASLNLRDVTLPITLRKRLHTQAFFTTVNAAGVGQMGEAYEWMWWTPPAGIDGTTDSKVRISARRFMGSSDELCHCDLFVTGYF